MSGNILVVDNAQGYRDEIGSKYGKKVIVYQAPTFKEAQKVFYEPNGIALRVTELVDVRQEEVSIEQLVNFVREHNEQEYLPIIAFTTLGSRPRLKTIARDLRLDVVIQKQYKEVLYAYIKTLLENPRKFYGNTRFHFLEKGFSL